MAADPDDPRRFSQFWDDGDEFHDSTIAEMFPDTVNFGEDVPEEVERLRVGEDTWVDGGQQQVRVLRTA